MRHLLRSIALIAGIIGLASPSTAKILKFEITRVDSPAFEGRSFGAIGTYDRIIGRATIAVSPAAPLPAKHPLSSWPLSLVAVQSRSQS